MKQDVFFQFGLALILYLISLPLFAEDHFMMLAQSTPIVPISNNIVIEKDKIFDPDILSFDSAQYYEKNFNFDWQNHATLEPNKKKIEEVKKFLLVTKHEDYSNLSALQQNSFGKIFLKLASYYAHIEHQPSLVIQCVDMANVCIKDKSDKAWGYDYLAYAYAQKFETSHREQDKNKALYYTDLIINKIYSHAKNKQVAFAYSVQGKLNNDEKNFGLAEQNLKTAINIYEKVPDGKDEQYARVRNRLATVVLWMNDRDDEAIKVLKELKNYWTEMGGIEKNPYAASTNISLAQAYLKIRDDEDARKELEQAISIYQTVYGKQSGILKYPYQLLSQIYKNLGKSDEAKMYIDKANAIKSDVE